MRRAPEVVTFAIRQWTSDPDAAQPDIEVANEEWLSHGEVRFLYTNTNRSMGSLASGHPDRIVVFVDQRVTRLNATPLIDFLCLAADPEDLIITSPRVRLSGEEAEPWHEPINPYAWAARGRTLADLRPVWGHHLQFGHEKLMAAACDEAGIEMVCTLAAVAKVADAGPASAVTNDLYYRQLEDAATVASVLGVEGPSA